ncbi:DEAD/DEAH box helicase [Thiopseudomonas denitrificans]|uniref:DEAD-box ATP-dependent RNA helicase RhpA n=1 Tax=Thiopseudomonas denitrificans TaxID=1501432 RepID=A0A4R6TTN2_9GAMM|nr:DEAD/DEAH box helicase [Thiopseudomonas denitrificans]TDQ36466.1 ATP-dependent RNA helicase RhlE [Thiopseudomonas denitrificans]
MSFASLGLSQALVTAVHNAGYETPTPVQQQAIPAALQGQDLMVAAQTGTGKTGGFALPILQKIFADNQEPARLPKQTRVLVLAPTRELAAQVEESFRLYATQLPFRSACVFGGVGINPQIRALAKGLDVLVACPGRLLDLIGQKAVDLSAVDTLVLDEADRMLDMGFIHDVKKVLKQLPAKRQNLLFSATFSKDITALANRLLHNPVRIEVTPPNTTVERIKQSMFLIPAPHKRALLAHLITMGAWEQVLVFTRTKHGANRLAEYLSKNGLPAAAIHGNKSQNARTKALADFKANEIRILVATDIAARGLDIDQLPHVVNYELPNVEEDYVHRIGRTGRAGRPGEAVSLVAHSEQKLLRDIEKVTGQRIPEGDWMGFDINQAIEAGLKAEEAEQAEQEPVRNQRRQAGGKSQRNDQESRGRRKGQQDATDNKQQNRGRQKAAATAEADSGNEQGKGRNQRQRNQNRDSNPRQTTRNNRNTHNAAGKPALPPDRDPEEFLDDEIDNFGNSVDYVSPYKNKPGVASGNRGRQQAPSERRPRAARNNNRSPQQGAGAGRNNTGRRQNQRHQQNPDLFVKADPTPAYIAAKREREQAGNAPLIIRKGERLPSLEQLEQLENARSPKKERPALLGLRD